MWPHGLYSPWNSAGQNTGVGSLSLLQGIFPSQGSNPGLPHCRRILYQLSHKGSPRILEWVAYPFSRGSSQSRDWTGGSCIAGRFFTSWAIRDPKYVCVCVCVCVCVYVFMWVYSFTYTNYVCICLDDPWKYVCVCVCVCVYVFMWVYSFTYTNYVCICLDDHWKDTKDTGNNCYLL